MLTSHHEGLGAPRTGPCVYGVGSRDDPCPQGAPRSMEAGATCPRDQGLRPGLGGDRRLGSGGPQGTWCPRSSPGGWVSEEGKAPGPRGPLCPGWSAEEGPPARLGQGQVWTCSGHKRWPSCGPEHVPSCSSAGLPTGPGQTGTAWPSVTTEPSSAASASHTTGHRLQPGPTGGTFTARPPECPAWPSPDLRRGHGGHILQQTRDLSPGTGLHVSPETQLGTPSGPSLFICPGTR